MTRDEFLVVLVSWLVERDVDSAVILLTRTGRGGADDSVSVSIDIETPGGTIR